MQRKPKVALDHRSGDLCGALSSVPNGQCCGYSSILWATNAHNPDIDNLFYMPYPQKMLFQGSLIFSPEQCPRPTVIFTILCWYLKSLVTSLRGGVGCVCYLEKKSSFWAPFLKYWGQGWTLDHVWLFPWVLFSFETGRHPCMSPESVWKDSRGIKKFFYTFPIVLLPAQKIVEVP